MVITSDNFNTPAMRAAMDDDGQVKVYLFTVQSLLKPESTVGRKTHKFQEGLGTEFYAHLQKAQPLVVFADEHHCYYGPAFSRAVRDSLPGFWLVYATPDKQTPKEQIIFRYPIAAAIADRLVKTPVIVGRRDDRKDALTKLTDGITLLDAKRDAIAAYAEATGATPVNPVMLVVAKDIADADEYGQILRSGEFFGGRYADSVLVVHSKAPDEALEQPAVEDPTSPVRIIISVGMLKEGWDVRNVYVIASMRANVSEILTEQTLGRGMRLPFGAYTDSDPRHAGGRRARALRGASAQGRRSERGVHRLPDPSALRINAHGQQVVVSETTTASADPVWGEGGLPPLVGDEWQGQLSRQSASVLKSARRSCR